MAELIRTDSSNNDFRELVRLLDTDLQLSDGEEHAFYAQFNNTDGIKHVIIAFEGDKAIGCGAFKEYKEGVAEIKRMFVREEHRKQGVATQLLNAIEEWAKEESYLRCILETGRNRPEAMLFYEHNNYNVINNFGPYENVANSVCYEKVFVAG